MQNKGKRKEVYDWVDMNDRTIGRGSARAGHHRGFYTRSVHILLTTPTGDVLVCKRPRTKKVYPNQYSSSAGGHVEYGESYRAAARRELKEELGISIPLRSAGRFDVVSDTEKAIHQLYIGHIRNNTSLNFNKDEIDSWHFASVQYLWGDIRRHPQKYALPFQRAFARYIKWKDGPTYVFDFDHTLFDWYRFKRDLESSLERSLEIHPALFQKAKDRQESGGRLYNIRLHLKEVATQSRVPLKDIQRRYSLLARALPTYIFRDARTCLRAIQHRKKKSLILLTYGDTENQKLFVRGTGVGGSFDTVLFSKTKKDKAAKLQKILRNPASIVLVNDDPGETQMLHGQLPAIDAIFLVERKTAKYYPIERKPYYTVVQDLSRVLSSKKQKTP